MVTKDYPRKGVVKGSRCVLNRDTPSYRSERETPRQEHYNGPRGRAQIANSRPCCSAAA